MVLPTLACLGVLLAPQRGGNPPQRPALPPEIVTQLDQEYQGWRIAPWPAKRSRARAGREGNVLRRDFDGDGTADFAVLIEYALGVEDFHVVRRGIVFVRDNQPLPLTGELLAEEDGPFLSLALKGQRKRDLDTEQDFTLERDAVQLEYDRRGPCLTFLYRSDRFEAVWTCK